MKKTLLLIVGVLAYSGTAAAFPEGAPAGHTGANNQQDCSLCHFAGPEPSAKSGLRLRGLPEPITPGTLVELTLVMLDPESKVGGFQAMIESGAWQTSSNQQVLTLNGDEYLTHTQPVSSDATDNGEMKTLFTLHWRVPDNLNICPTLYAAAVAADDDDSPLGDNVYTLRQTLCANEE